ncbi:MAG: response regulator [Anaerolineae bacterium]|nr:response regulator [Anaerolineae bacterium]
MKTILVVDDDMLTQTLFRRLLEPLDVQVVGASSSDEGIRLAREVHPALILMDIYLPGEVGNGLLATRIIRSEDELQNIPIILITAGVVPYEEVNTLPGIPCLRKPFELKKLMETVKSALG